MLSARISMHWLNLFIPSHLFNTSGSGKVFATSGDFRHNGDPKTGGSLDIDVAISEVLPTLSTWNGEKLPKFHFASQPLVTEDLHVGLKILHFKCVGFQIVPKESMNLLIIQFEGSVLSCHFSIRMTTFVLHIDTVRVLTIPSCDSC
jgi:hypothetical protein